MSSITAVAAGGVDVGTVQAFPMGVPDKFLECNGATISRTLYSKLFDVIGVLYGAGDGSTTFTIPDYRGRFLRGQADGSGNDPDRGSRTNRGDGTTGDSVGTKQTNQIQSHRHTHSINTSGAAAASSKPYRSVGTSPVNYTGNYVGGNETRPININVIYGIKY
jgi:microcystin-dependent protein